MEQTQIKYMLDNGISEADCSSCTKSIVGSVKSYSKHLVICSGDSSRWISHIAEAGVPAKIAAALERCNKELYRQSDIIVTATDFIPVDDSNRNVQIISYPEKIMYSVPLAADFYLFIRDVVLKEDFAELELSLSLAAASIENVEAVEESSDYSKLVGVAETAQLESVIPNTLPWKTLILVCVHGSRDNRCGRAGPQIIEEFRSQLLERSINNDSITVAGSSHIGGHKYAGVLVVYPSGDWYGLISKRNVGELLDNILAGTKYLKGWRGNESLNW